MAASSASAVPITTQHIKLHRFKCNAIHQKYLHNMLRTQLLQEKGGACLEKLRIMTLAEASFCLRPLVDRTKMEPREPI
eukprot:scaffold7805_cov199-Skeletonema_marinoi.AAC.1